jgi:hypothetical protein
MRIALALLAGAQAPIAIWLLGWNFTRGEAAFWCYFIGVLLVVMTWAANPLHRGRDGE